MIEAIIIALLAAILIKVAGLSKPEPEQPIKTHISLTIDEADTLGLDTRVSIDTLATYSVILANAQTQALIRLEAVSPNKDLFEQLLTIGDESNAYRIPKVQRAYDEYEKITRSLEIVQRKTP